MKRRIYKSNVPRLVIFATSSPCHVHKILFSRVSFLMTWGKCLLKSLCLFWGHFMTSLKLGMTLSLSLSSPDMHGCRCSRFTTAIPAINTLCQNKCTELLYHVNINSIELIICLHFVHITDLFKGICSTILLFKFGREPMSMNNDDSCL